MAHMILKWPCGLIIYCLLMCWLFSVLSGGIIWSSCFHKSFDCQCWWGSAPVLSRSLVFGTGEGSAWCASGLQWRQELISDSRQDPGAAAFSTGQSCSNRSHQTTVSQSGGRQSLINGPHDHMTQLSVGPPLSSSSSFLFPPPLSLSLSLSLSVSLSLYSGTDAQDHQLHKSIGTH